MSAKTSSVFSPSFSLSHSLSLSLPSQSTQLTRVDVLDRHLEPVEGPRLGDLHLVHEPRTQVLEDDAVRGREEGEHVRDKVALVVGELVPVGEVVGEVDLLGLRRWWKRGRRGRRGQMEGERERGGGSDE